MMPSKGKGEKRERNNQEKPNQNINCLCKFLIYEKGFLKKISFLSKALSIIVQMPLFF